MAPTAPSWRCRSTRSARPLRYATAQVTRQSSGFSGGNRGGFGGGNNGGFQNNGGYQGGAGYSGGASYQSGGYQGGASSAPMAAQSGPAVDPWSDAGSGSSFSSFGATTDFGGDSEEPSSKPYLFQYASLR